MFDVREKPKLVERALLVGVFRADESEEQTLALLDELEELVATLGIDIGGMMLAKVRLATPKLLVGTGKADEIVARAKADQCDCIVFDAELTPGQQRNWETLSSLCVIDRQEIILDIFRERAQTKEAVLQVALARAQHSLPRLKNAWTHLSRQRGGGGVTQRGEGEAQIELDQRMVRDSIATLRKELEVVVKQRHVQRHQRQRVPLPSGAIVGYTNAGKSTLLNRLTGAHVVAEDKLFATLDPTTRQLILPHGQKLLLTDTVGFVRRLPHGLIEAFKATLEESVQSDFLIHVMDLTNPDLAEHFETTCKVLEELGVGEKPSLYIYNKVDGLDLKSGELPPPLVGSDLPTKDALFVSARTGAGTPELLESIEKLLAQTRHTVELLVPHSRYDVINKLHQAGAIRHEAAEDEGVHVVALIPESMGALVAEFEVKAGH